MVSDKNAICILMIFLLLLFIPASFASDVQSSIVEIPNEEDIISVNNSFIDSDNIDSLSSTADSDDNSTYMLSRTITVTGGNAQSISNAISSASAGDTIILEGNFIGDNAVYINKALSITGKNCVIDGQHKIGFGVFFNLQAQNIYISNIVFKNFGDVNNLDNGKLMTISFLSSAQYCTLDNCTFMGSYSNDGQVAINGIHNNVINCKFYDNIGANDGGILDINVGYNTINHCIFINNIAGYHGDPYYAYGGAISCADGDTTECKILNSYFESCTSTLNAGPIRFGSTREVIENCTFYKCYAPNQVVQYILADNPLYYVSFRDMTLKNITCYECSANEGSAIYIYGDETKVQNSKMYNNTAVNGAIYVKGADSTLTEIELYDNTASNDDGAIYISGERASLNDLILHQNVAINGGAIKVDGNNAQFTNINAYENNATGNGGALYIIANNVKFNNVTANRNTAIDGGAIYVAGNSAEFIHVTGKDNNANGFGGAIYVSGISALFDDFNLTFNNANAGSAVAVIGNVASKDNAIRFKEGYIKNNAATLGGAIYIDASYTEFKDMDYYDNKASYGGAAYIIGDYTDIKHSNFI